MRRNLLRTLAGPAVVLLLALTVLAPALTAWANPSEQVTVNDGTVIALQNMPHIFVGDAQGVLHWAGDTRALANRFVDWNSRREVSLDTLKGLRRGDPYLSAGLLKIGDPIYLVKWETNQNQPTLLHIQSIADVELFGINATNYGNFVMDKTTWERQFGLNSDALPRGELVGATAPAATVTPTAVPNPLSAKLDKVERTGTNVYKTTLVVTDIQNTRLRVALVGKEYVYRYDDTNDNFSTRDVSWGPLDMGTTDATTGKLTWTDTHSAYRSYTYTITDAAGNKVTIDVGDDTTRGLNVIVAPSS